MEYPENKNKTTATHDMDEYHNITRGLKKPDTKDYILIDLLAENIKQVF